jgi:arginyl-tRNA synthetase
MTDYEQILVEQLNTKISKSILKDYDFQIRIVQDQNINNIITNQIINDNFIIEISNNNKFINFKIKQDNLLLILKKYSETKTIKHLIPNKKSKKILYDYSSPNMAKDMHVGHMRSTIIGDCLANLSELLSDTVFRINHLGDCGLPFGMIIQHIIESNIEINDNTILQELYTAARQKFDDKSGISNSLFQNNSYINTQKLQMGDEYVSNIWNKIYNLSLKQYQNVYSKLYISPNLEIKGESFYLQYIPIVKELLEKQNKLENNNGRLQVKIENSNPLTFMKSESKGGAYTYDTTDIVALWYRSYMSNVDEIYYVVDSGQSEHFKLIFKVGYDMGWINNNVYAKHLDFGVITGDDGGRLKARNGQAPKLLDFINNAIDATKKNCNEFMDISKIESIAIGSIKYYDLSKSRSVSYQFKFSDMLKSEGNSYIYVTYALARIYAIKKKAQEYYNTNLEDNLKIDYNDMKPEDYNILRKIVLTPNVLLRAYNTKMPHYLCEFLFKLSESFHNNYTKLQCIQYSHNEHNEQYIVSINESRLMLYNMVGNIIEMIFGILGLPSTIEI